MGKVNSISRKPVGRRSGGVDTRQHILEAAQALFAQKGLDRTTLRQIGDRAGVDPALIVHYFKTKQRLFIASLEVSDYRRQSDRLIAAISEGPREQAGERLARAFMAILSNPGGRALLLGIVRSATSDEQAAALLRDSVQKRLLDELERHIPGPDSRLKATLMGSQLIGIIMMRYVARVEPLASALPEAIVCYLAPRLQAQLEAEQI